MLLARVLVQAVAKELLQRMAITCNQPRKSRAISRGNHVQSGMQSRCAPPLTCSVSLCATRRIESCGAY